jgi:ADP-dependent phosphofructokinase/glucokinase
MSKPGGGGGFMYKMFALSAACYAGKMVWDKNDLNGQLSEKLLDCISSGFTKCGFGGTPLLTLTNEEKNAVIKRYVERGQKIKAKKDCLMGVGYNACTDISFRAADLIQLIEP